MTHTIRENIKITSSDIVALVTTTIKQMPLKTTQTCTKETWQIIRVTKLPSSALVTQSRNIFISHEATRLRFPKEQLTFFK